MNSTSRPERENDDWLISRCQSGDLQAFGVLVEKYKQRAYYTALGLVGSHEDALDLSQEAFVRAYRSLGKFQPSRGSFFTWYYKILRNRCFNFLRDRVRQPRSFSVIGESKPQLLEIPDENCDPTVIAERNEIKDAVWRAISSLNEHEREIIILRDFQGLSYKEIAETLDCPIGTVMSRLFNARRQLREKLNGYL
ncbi:MAG: sigma-70 family RNA polymerase sigma factor [candidate division KSB1 bacterium]|nr:sigma-70 family RNA polymerase sigma factor [candidate division KSB1 bacterium]MDZ7300723.1 sigma-70 family RNA polymerase sigma factor [candidate division KSB1 bacterium]MDZ7310007.1 sigma-70 family RNA polymerase sigma factor [candidate division KSB1 bacterium]